MMTIVFLFILSVSLYYVYYIVNENTVESLALQHQVGIKAIHISVL